MTSKAPQTITELQQMVVQFRDARDWKQFHNAKDMALSLVLEAAEVLEHFQWKTEKDLEAHVAKKKGDIGEELSDVLYWVLLMADEMQIDLPEVFVEKMKQNEAKYPIEKAKGRNTKYTDL